MRYPFPRSRPPALGGTVFGSITATTLEPLKVFLYGATSFFEAE